MYTTSEILLRESTKAKCSYYCKGYASLLYWDASYSDCIISYVPIEITTGTTLREKN